MNVALRKRMTIEEFPAWEDRQQERWEFDGSQPVALVRGTRARPIVNGDSITALNPRLRGGPCRAIIEGVKIKPAGRVRYPDLFVECGPSDNQGTIADNPVVVFEGQSPSTSSVGMIEKNAEYRAAPSNQCYVMLAQDRIAATVFERRGEEWVGTLFTDAQAVLHMPEIGLSLPLLECSEGVIEPG